MRLKLFGWFYFGKMWKTMEYVFPGSYGQIGEIPHGQLNQTRLFDAVGHNEMNGTKEWNELPPTVHKLPM